MRWDKVRPRTLERFARVEAAVNRGQDIYVSCKGNKISPTWFKRMIVAREEIKNEQKEA